jgi:5-methylcytosine-specific restriction enzyme A
MLAYLLTWNPAKYAWHALDEDWEAFCVGYQEQHRWSCGNTRKIRVGDRVFLMRLGTLPKGIVLSGIARCEPYQGEHWDEHVNKPAMYIEFVIDRMLHPDLHPVLNPETVSREIDWYPQRSGITIPEPIAQQLEIQWHSHLEHLSLGDLIGNRKTYKEGSHSRVEVNRYERNPDARNDCIIHFGDSCAVCEMTFFERYGEIGEGFINIHHLKPLSQRGQEYVVDPENDLIPVCPNCHAMLHRKSPPYSIEELRAIITNHRMYG